MQAVETQNKESVKSVKAKSLTDYLPFILKGLLAIWPIIGLVPFILIFLSYFSLSRNWLKLSEMSELQVRAIYKLALKISVIAMFLSIIFFTSIHNQTILSLVSFSMILLYGYMLFQLFFRIKAVYFEQP